VCCSFGCWHCGHVAREAAVVFHWLRRERVLEREVFRFGTGTFLTSSSFPYATVVAGRKYPLKTLFLEIGAIYVQGSKPSPSSIDNLVSVVLG
jgi:hypothetical protein